MESWTAGRCLLTGGSALSRAVTGFQARMRARCLPPMLFRAGAGLSMDVKAGIGVSDGLR